MGGIFGSKWAAQYGDLPTNPDGSLTTTGKLWATSLSGLEVERGVKATIEAGNEWPPSLPTFRESCKLDYAELGMPTPNDAYRQAAMGIWGAHGAVYAAARVVGTWELRQQEERRTRPLYLAEYAKIAEQVAVGIEFVIPPGPPKLEHLPVSTKATRDSFLAKMRTSLRTLPPEELLGEEAREYAQEQQDNDLYSDDEVLH
jgi:hypothetical protein